MTSSTANLTELRHAVPDGVISIARLREAGVSNHALSARCRPSGPWQRVLPGVVLLSSAPPTRRQQLRAALEYAGPEAVITGVDAMRAANIDVPERDDVLMLVPSWRRLSSRAYLTVERTTRPPEPVWPAELPMAPLVRATLDAARRVRDHGELKALLLAPVNAGACTIAALQTELATGSQRGSAAVRAMLAEEAHTVVSMTVGMARRVIRDAQLPAPRWQVRLHDQSGNYLGVADAWWEEVNLAWDIGGKQRISAPSAPALAGAGMTLLQTDPKHLHTDPDAVTTSLLTAFIDAAANKRRNPP
jgi:hypothetical protein